MQTTPLTPSNEVLHKREAANRRQRECRARKKAAAITPCSGTLMQPTTASLSMGSEVVNARLAETTKDAREERNRKQREYRQKKKLGLTNLDGSVSSLTPVQPANEERNRKQREYRARKNSVIEDAHSPITPAIPAEPTASVSVKHETGNSQPAKLSNEQREERNRKERKYRKRKRDEMNNVDISVLSNTPMQLLTISSSMQSDGGNICRDEKFEKQREDRNRKQREYRARRLSQTMLS